MIAQKRTIVMKKSPIVARTGFFPSVLNGRTSFDKKLTSSIRDGFIGSTIEFLAIVSSNLPASSNRVRFFTFLNGINFVFSVCERQNRTQIAILVIFWNLCPVFCAMMNVGNINNVMVAIYKTHNNFVAPLMAELNDNDRDVAGTWLINFNCRLR